MTTYEEKVEEIAKAVYGEVTSNCCDMGNTQEVALECARLALACIIKPTSIPIVGDSCGWAVVWTGKESNYPLGLDWVSCMPDEINSMPATWWADLPDMPEPGSQGQEVTK